uniref:thiol-disulfide oxidoreductase DCC family protein n=1 Tax=Fulvivirga sp. TaxID=1931237 RepID=UPI0040498CE0
MGTINKIESPVILFDGVCNLCNSSINFVIDRDKHKKYKFASLQSQFGQQLAASIGKDIDMQSVLLVENGKVLDRSNAALEIARNLSGAWPVLYVFKAVPSFLRNIVYDFISRNRYRWFGKQEFCRMPSAELKSLFLD